MESRTVPPAHGRYPGIDGLRAFSVILVVLMHGWHSLPAMGIASKSLSAVLGNGPFGVRIFFVISGFLITHLLRRERDRTGRIALGKFYARRARRILPAYFAFLVGMAAIKVAGWIDPPWPHLLLGLTFLMNYESVLLPDSPDAIFVKHAWSLSLEEQFYALWPLALILLGFRGAGRGAAVIVMLSPFIRVATYYFWPESRNAIWMMWHSASDAIMVGCLAALVGDDPRFKAAFSRFRSPAWPIGVFLAVWVVSSVLAAKFRGMWILTVGITVESLAAAFLLLWIVNHPTATFTRALAWRPLAHVGVLSYSIYLWQQLFTLLPETFLLGRFPWNFLATLFMAEASYWLIERPFLRMGANGQKNGRQEEPPASLSPTTTFTEENRVE
jgi:peptidoglycan/LPS O-acetylase OafA/YrhL